MRQPEPQSLHKRIIDRKVELFCLSKSPLGVLPGKDRFDKLNISLSHLINGDVSQTNSPRNVSLNSVLMQLCEWLERTQQHVMLVDEHRRALLSGIPLFQNYLEQRQQQQEDDDEESHMQQQERHARALDRKERRNQLVEHCRVLQTQINHRQQQLNETEKFLQQEGALVQEERNRAQRETEEAEHHRRQQQQQQALAISSRSSSSSPRQMETTAEKKMRESQYRQELRRMKLQEAQLDRKLTAARSSSTLQSDMVRKLTQSLTQLHQLQEESKVVRTETRSQVYIAKLQIRRLEDLRRREVLILEGLRDLQLDYAFNHYAASLQGAKSGVMATGANSEEGTTGSVPLLRQRRSSDVASLQSEHERIPMSVYQLLRAQLERLLAKRDD